MFSFRLLTLCCAVCRYCCPFYIDLNLKKDVEKKKFVYGVVKLHEAKDPRQSEINERMKPKTTTTTITITSYNMVYNAQINRNIDAEHSREKEYANRMN